MTNETHKLFLSVYSLGSLSLCKTCLGVYLKECSKICTSTKVGDDLIIVFEDKHKFEFFSLNILSYYKKHTNFSSF